MFGNLVIWYLFLGGSGAALVALLSLSDFAFWLRARRMQAGRAPGALLAWTADLSPTLMACGLTVASCALALGALCLLADLGRPERFLYVFALPTPSVLTFGSFVLGATLVCGLFLAAVSLMRLDRVSPVLIRGAEAVGALAGLSTAVYTGVLLAQLIDTVPLWNAALPVLFCCSSLSVAAAVLIACQLLGGTAGNRLVRAAARLDLVLIVLEMLAFIAWALAGASAVGGAAFGDAVLLGEESATLWLGFIAPALVIPLLLELAYLRWRTPALVAASVPFVVAGGFFLRYCIVNIPLVGIG